jgi:hypothetical protein
VGEAFWPSEKSHYISTLNTIRVCEVPEMSGSPRGNHWWAPLISWHQELQGLQMRVRILAPKTGSHLSQHDLKEGFECCGRVQKGLSFGGAVQSRKGFFLCQARLSCEGQYACLRGSRIFFPLRPHVKDSVTGCLAMTESETRMW